MSKEYIERGMAIAAITGWETDPTDEELEWALNNVPAADVVEVKHGEWDARLMTDIGAYWVYWCSECNNFSYFKYDYCTNCGAKMLND